MASRPAQKLPQTLSAEEVRALMARPNLNCPTGLRNRCVLELMHRAGLRNSECRKLALRDLDWPTGELFLRADVAKGGHEAVVYLDAETMGLLERWKAVRRHYGSRSPLLFVTLTGGQLDRHYVWEMTARYGRRAGIEWPVHPHTLRHTFATELLREGDFNLREVQELMRHRDIRNTQIYTHVFDAELRAKMRRRRGRPLKIALAA